MDESGFFTFPLSVCVLYVKGSWSLKSLQVDKRHHLHTTIISHAGISSKNVPTTSLWFLHHNKGVFRLKIALHFNTHRPAFLQVPVRWGTLNLEVQIEGLLDTKSMGVLRELDMAQRFSLYYFWDIFTNRGPWERDMTRKQTRERKYILSLSLRVSNSCHSYNDLLCPNACDANSRISTTLHHTVYILPGLCACALCLDWPKSLPVLANDRLCCSESWAGINFLPYDPAVFHPHCANQWSNWNKWRGCVVWRSPGPVLSIFSVIKPNPQYLCFSLLYHRDSSVCLVPDLWPGP